ncbi:MAG TPA: hypothetical protein DCQ83_08170 [Fibrobacteres bacterium]|jgi:hypothetical protein|nr:hypothetical protein [Fibrobacterota bacterium]
MQAPDPRDHGKCEHFQPADLTVLAEQYLREADIPETEWDGRRFHWGGVIESPPFKGIVMQCKRKDGNWVLTKLDRRKDGITPDEEGFRPL